MSLLVVTTLRRLLQRDRHRNIGHRRYTFHCAEQCSIDDVVVSTSGTSVHVSLDSMVVLKRSVSLVNADLAFNNFTVVIRKWKSTSDKY